MKLDHAINIECLRDMARRRAPTFLFDMIEGGVDEELGVQDATESFRRRKLQPMALIDVESRDQSTELFGRRWKSPFGISATGPAPIYRVKADDILAETAAANGVPFMLSGASGSSMERIRSIAGSNAWCQIYGARDRSITKDMIRRAGDCGYETLVVTIDTQAHPRRERHLRNRFTTPIKLKRDMLFRILKEGLSHPAWALDYIRTGGMPMMENWQPYAPMGASAMAVAEFFGDQFPCSQTWADIENYRSLWPGKMVAKGVLNPLDAARLMDMGIDGITVSNHGGKIIDRALAPLDALPYIKAAVGDRATVMLDGGVRRGSDVVIARCLGADFVFVGRATLYGVTAAGRAGAQKAIDILRTEVDAVLGSIGCPVFDDLSAENLEPGSRPSVYPALQLRPAESVTCKGLHVSPLND